MIFKRIWLNTIILCGVVLLTLVLFRFLPGSAFDDEAYFHPDIYNKYILPLKNQSLTAQFQSFTLSLLSAKGPPSLLNPEVSLYSIIASSWRATGSLMLTGLLWTTFFFSILVHLSSLLRLRTTLESAINFMSSISTLILAPIIVYIFILKWSLVSPRVFLGESLLLPSLLVAYRPFCLLARLYLVQQNELHSRIFVQVHRACGFSDQKIQEKFLWPHFLPTLRLAAVQIALNLFAGSVLIETLFGLPGLGSEFLKALQERDINIALGLVFLISVVTLVSYQFVQHFNHKQIKVTT